MRHFSHIINVCGRNGRFLLKNYGQLLWLWRSTLTLHHHAFDGKHIQNFSLPCHAIIQSKRNYVFNIQENIFKLPVA